MRKVRIEDAHRIRTAADAGDDDIGLAAGELRHLREAFLADHALEVAHHHRVRMRSRHAADDVKRVLNVGHPVAHRLVQRVLERLRPGLDRDHFGTEKLHAENVLRLAQHVLGAHVHDAFHAEARGDRRGRDTVLPRAGLGNHTRLGHAPCEQRLADAVIDLVRAGMIEILALEVDLCAAEPFRPAPGVVDRAGPADVMLELALELRDELRIAPVPSVLLTQLVERMDQRLGDEHASVRAEMAALVG